MVYVFALSGLAAITWLQTSAQLPSPWLWVSLLTIALISGYWHTRRIARFLCIALLGAGLLGGWAQICSVNRLNSYLPEAQETQMLVLEGTIIDIPERRPGRTRLTIAIHQGPAPELASGSKLLLSEYETPRSKIQNYHAGERWSFTTKLKRPHGSLNPGGWDTEAWLWAHGIRATGSIKSARFIEQAGGFTPQLARLREQLSERIQSALRNKPSAGLIAALVVGDGSAIPREQWTLFAATGITHLVSISGLHITLIASMVAGLCGGLWDRIPKAPLLIPTRRFAIAFGLSAALVYALLAGFSVPTQRTLFMLATVAISYLWRQQSLLQALAWALIVVLFHDPFSILAPGTWLSFGAVAIMSIGASGKIGNASIWREWGRAQTAVTLGLIPVLIFTFGQFPWTSPLANAIAIPVISAIVTPLALFGAIINWDIPLIWAEHGASFLLPFLHWCAQWGQWQNAIPTHTFVILASTGVIYTVLARGTPSRYLGLITLLPLLTWQPSTPNKGEWQATVFDVGQGLAVLIQTQHYTMLYDTGPDWPGEGDSGTNTLIPALRALGVNKLNQLVLSHNDNDHTGGAESILAAIPVEKLYASLPSNQRLWTKAQSSALCNASETWTVDEVTFEVLNPEPDLPADNDNDTSCVIRLSGKNGSLLLTGDIGADREQMLVDKWGGKLASTVLIAPHHGSKNSSSGNFISATHPQSVIFSSGYKNHFRHPHPDTLARYSEQDIYRTDEDGAVAIDTKTKPTTLSHQKPRFWRDR